MEKMVEITKKGMRNDRTMMKRKKSLGSERGNGRPEM
jgi:hypothetical protein